MLTKKELLEAIEDIPMDIIFMAYLEAYENVEPVIYRNDTDLD